MAILKTKHIRAMKYDELAKRLSELKLELLKEMGNVKMGRPIKNPGRVRELRRTIAKIKTIQNEIRRAIKK
jgi:large subunit ribosomal protein L29